MITFVYGILAGIGSAISFGSFGEPQMSATGVDDVYVNSNGVKTTWILRH